MQTRKTRPVKVGGLTIGGTSPITVQSMLSLPAADIAGNVAVARALELAGCDILRVAVPAEKDSALIAALKSAVTIPIVADIHFDYKIALRCVEAGVDKIRLNPGNIGGDDNVRAVAEACADRGVPIRVGVNAGSLERHILERFGGVTAEALVASALEHAALLERFGFSNIVLSLKSSDLPLMVEAYTLAAAACDYPLHLGVTEAGTLVAGLVKSGAGIGSLLLAGVGDTIRISLTDEPAREVEAGIALLRALGLRSGPRVISCPTCGRTKIDLIPLAKEVERRLAACQKDIRVAVMGCAVNGPGEAREADIGICGGDGCGLLIKKGEILRKVPEERLLDELMLEIDQL